MTQSQAEACVCSSFFAANLTLRARFRIDAQGGVGLLLVNETYFPRLLHIDINLGAIIQVHPKKLSWDCLPSVSPKLINIPLMWLQLSPFVF